MAKKKKHLEVELGDNFIIVDDPSMLFDTRDLLDAVDIFDSLRPIVSDKDGSIPPDMRDDLLKLHRFAMNVFNHGYYTQAEEIEEMFDLTDDINSVMFQLEEGVERIRAILWKLLETREKMLSDDEDE
jgi:hypothetical protein